MDVNDIAQVIRAQIGMEEPDFGLLEARPININGGGGLALIYKCLFGICKVKIFILFQRIPGRFGKGMSTMTAFARRPFV